jgi:uncharacterized OsmC-like protein
MGKDNVMDAGQIRALQAQIKERYKESPEKAVTPARAEAVIEEDDISCRISTYAGTRLAGLHPATGGDGPKACSADMLMEALVACASVTLKAVATAMRIPLKHARAVANGTWDARGTLAVDRDTPVGLKEVKLQFEIDSTVERKKLEKMIELTERYCVNYQTLAKPPTLKSEFEVL